MIGGEIREQMTYLQGEELACPAEDDHKPDQVTEDDFVGQLVDEPVELQ